MSRSDYIYLVRDENDKVVCAATVKYEVFQWAERSGLKNLRLSRMRGGVFEDKTETPMEWEYGPTDALPRLCALDILKAFYSIRDLGDYAYNIREREGQGWTGPLVQAWGRADEAAKELIYGKAKRLEASGREATACEAMVEDSHPSEEPPQVKTKPRTTRRPAKQ